MPKMSPPAGQGALAPTFDLFDLGVRIMRQNLRRLHPEATEDEIDRRLGEWVQHRPGADGGDAVGPSVDPHARLK
jgi:hypothetical protein